MWPILRFTKIDTIACNGLMKKMVSQSFWLTGQGEWNDLHLTPERHSANKTVQFYCTPHVDERDRVKLSGTDSDYTHWP